MDPWVEELNEQAIAAQSLVPAAVEWLMEPIGKECESHNKQYQIKLASQIAKFVAIAG